MENRYKSAFPDNGRMNNAPSRHMFAPKSRQVGEPRTSERSRSLKNRNI